MSDTLSKILLFILCAIIFGTLIFLLINLQKETPTVQAQPLKPDEKKRVEVPKKKKK
ncbi:MAG: hypothetical protein AABY84_02145 [Candidatus Firestonebacteria bacterium]